MKYAILEIGKDILRNGDEVLEIGWKPIHPSSYGLRVLQRGFRRPWPEDSETVGQLIARIQSLEKEIESMAEDAAGVDL